MTEMGLAAGGILVVLTETESIKDEGGNEE